MATLNGRSRLASLLAATALSVSALLPDLPAQAQDAAQGAVDPPWRVGRLARIVGSVSTHGPGATDWVAASLNSPLISGDAIWTQPGAGAAMQLADNGLVLSEATELDIATLDDHQLLVTQPQGELFVDLRTVSPGDATSITTPRGVVMLSGAGQYDIVAGDSANPTAISVVSGSAQIVSGSFSLAVCAGQTASVTGSDSLQGTVGVLVRGAFLSAQLAGQRPAPAGPPSVRYMTGSESLAQYGIWQQAPEYGQVWYPQVSADWAPYREGSWSYVQPWGWTWVDSEPWGFAPFHYGRWAQFGGRWGWVPGEPGAPPDVYERPAYAPALVDFIAAGAVAGAVGGVVGGLIAGGFGHGGRDGDRGPGGSGGEIGWVPLGPHERYSPTFRTGPTYLQRINYGRMETVRNDKTVVNNTTTIINSYANRNALTVVPASAMVRSQPIRGIARTGVGALAAAAPGGASQYRLVQGPLPVRPAAETRGLTSAAAHSLGLGAMPARQAAPGPAIDPALFHPRELPASRTPFRGQSGVISPVAPRPAPRPLPRPASGSAAASVIGSAHGPVAVPGPQGQPVRPGLPGLRAPGAAPPNLAAARQAPAGVSPGAPHGAVPEGRPGAGPQAPNPARLGPAPRPPLPPARPDGARPVPDFQSRAEARPSGARSAPRAEPVRQAPPRLEPRPEPRPEARRPEPQRTPPHPQMARPEPPRPAPNPAPRPAPRPAPPPHRDEHPGH